jgi:hypothetical protein
VDHALRTGDSLVGLSLEQITATHWEAGKPPTFAGQFVNALLQRASATRAAIREKGESASEQELRQLLDSVLAITEDARLIGDGIIGAFFAEDKPKKRIAQLVEFQKVVLAHLGKPDWIELALSFARRLEQGAHPVRPFHWQLEFPEAFEGENRGFDAIVGNPPFAGKNTVAAGHREHYPAWLQTLHEGAHGNSDIVAHFFRRAFELLRAGGAFGLIATNTIGQGDTRATGLATILADGGVISNAKRREPWPGEAAVIVSLVHVQKGAVSQPMLDGRPVRRISAYLVEGDLDVSPKPLAANAGRAFQGSIVLGMGFTFDDEAAAKGTASSLADMERLIAKDPRNAARIFPYIGGEEVNNDPRQAHRRYVLNISDLTLAQARTGFPDLLEVVEFYVKQERVKVKDDFGRTNWWRYLRPRPELHAAIRDLNHVWVTNRGAAPHWGLVQLASGSVFANTLIVFTNPRLSFFGTMQCRIYEAWARSFGSTLKDDFAFGIDECFRNFPFPPDFETEVALQAAGQVYHDHRAALMVARNEGITRTYNRFHDPVETADDIQRLRELHAALDRAVLETYGWHDLAARAEPRFLDETTEDDHAYQGRLFWPSDFRDEVLARLLALNAARHAEEVRLGTAPGMRGRAAADEGDEEGT